MHPDDETPKGQSSLDEENPLHFFLNLTGEERGVLIHMLGLVKIYTMCHLKGDTVLESLRSEFTEEDLHNMSYGFKLADRAITALGGDPEESTDATPW